MSRSPTMAFQQAQVLKTPSKHISTEVFFKITLWTIHV